MPRYLVLIDYADGMYGATFPDAPGATAMGSTQDEAIANATDALAEWAADELSEGRGLPDPHGLNDLWSDPDVRNAVMGGAVIAAVPVILDTGKPTRANISIDTGLLAEIDEVARRHGVTRSAFLAAAARDKIKAEA